MPDESLITAKMLIEGLTTTEANQRQHEYGLNAVETTYADHWFSLLARQFKSLIVWVLAAAAVVSFSLGDFAEGLAILVVLAINALTGFALEWNANRSMEALRRLAVTLARVVRDGQVQEIPADQLTLGDLLLVEAGDVVGADATLLEVHQLEIDESTLTGESFPVAKSTELVGIDSPTGDQKNQLFKGTAVTAGTGRAIITAIGEQTELGKIARLVSNAKPTATPLEAKLDALSQVLVWVTLGIAALFVLVGLLRSEPIGPLVKTSIALAIAAIPEGLSVVATLALAYGMLHLARHQVLVKKLSAVETLGSTSVIFTDKTGTLTENKIDVSCLQLMGEEQDVYSEVGIDGSMRSLEGPETNALEKLIRLGVLCNNAELALNSTQPQELGDPIEIAMLKFARSSGYIPDTIRKQYSRLAEQPFSSDTRVMATLHQTENGYLVAVKGAIEDVLALCPQLSPSQRERQLHRAESMAKEGLRTLAFAYREVGELPHLATFAQGDLTFNGLIGFLDPPRLAVIPAIQACKTAGIRVIMVTGDHPTTALTIARQIELIKPTDTLVLTGKDLKAIDQLSEAKKSQLLQCQVFARVSATQKLALIDFYQQQGNIVGMTGDGVNDAPALKKADIGIAMGLRGTPVATEAADLVLKDDSFTSIVLAIGQGRVIFENIRKFVLYLLSCNLSEIFVVAVAGLSGLGTPLLPLQILFVNIVTDVFPALALGIGRENSVLMKHPPRPAGRQLISATDWRRVTFNALILGSVVLGVYSFARWHWHYTVFQCNTLTFYMLCWVQLLHVFTLYSGNRTSLLKNEITRNRFIWMALLLCISLLLITYYVPVVSQVLAIQPLNSRVLVLLVVAGLLTVGLSWRGRQIKAIR
ncbi:cation-translocating P-type ATPase [Spirosoma litoris]